MEKKYLPSIMDDLTIICDEVIESYNEEVKTIPTIVNEKKITYKRQSFYILLVFLLTTTTLLIAVSIYCYLINYRVKKILLLHNTNNKQVLYWSYKLRMSVKDINIKNNTHYSFNDIINIKDYDSNVILIDKKLHKNILIYCIGYVTTKKDLKIYTFYTLFLIK